MGFVSLYALGVCKCFVQTVSCVPLLNIRGLPCRVADPLDQCVVEGQWVLTQALAFAEATKLEGRRYG